MNEELIKRIDAYIDCDDVRERESETQLLEDCRAALSRKYVPMTDDEAELLEEVSAYSEKAIYTEQGTIKPRAFARLRTIETVVIRRAGLEVQE